MVYQGAKISNKNLATFVKRTRAM
ncbi:hypothetical protein PBCVCan184_956R [Paramecium bursaria Chlorella virus Can18-4]|nr:hypothetical protein PBCVCan184_956R [Paramecium bursaria Chlorella virus Can18-4]